MKSLNDVPISILDLAKYREGGTPADAFRSSTTLAQAAENFGYRRFWLAEHHNLEGIASAATAVLLGHVAERTRTIRVGSGGIMLPNHSPLVISEQFGTLASLYPDRIDLGLGRAPGSDRLTMQAVRGETHGIETDFGDLIEELVQYFAPARAGQRVKAIPGNGMEIPIWILGSSLYSARLAARLGRPYAFAGHFAPAQMLQAFALYRHEFQPSPYLDKPHTMAGVPVVAAETDEEAEHLATTVYQLFLGVIRGRIRAVQPPVESMNNLWSPQEESAVATMTRILVVGGPNRVRESLQEIVNITGADELIMTSDVYDHAKRLRSFEIIAECAGKTPVAKPLNRSVPTSESFNA